MRTVLRLLLYFEGITTVFSGIGAMLYTEKFIPIVSAQTAAPSAADAVRQLGATWVVCGLLVLLATQVKDARSLRLMLIPLLVGDVLHALALWPWTTHALPHLIPTVLYFFSRGTIVWRTDWFVGKKIQSST